MKFKIEIDCGNAAFDDQESEGGAEVARILRELAEKVELLPVGWQLSPIALHDINGNRVGEARYIGR